MFAYLISRIVILIRVPSMKAALVIFLVNLILGDIVSSISGHLDKRAMKRKSALSCIDKRIKQECVRRGLVKRAIFRNGFFRRHYRDVSSKKWLLIYQVT